MSDRPKRLSDEVVAALGAAMGLIERAESPDTDDTMESEVLELTAATGGRDDDDEEDSKRDAVLCGVIELCGSIFASW